MSIETVLAPSPALALRPFVSLWRNRELFRRILLRDLQATFRGSVLGVAWVVLSPLALVVVYTFVFGIIMRSNWSTATRSQIEVPLVFFCGLVVFQAFMEVLMRAPNFIRDNRTYVTKIVFPLDILSWVFVGTAMLRLLIGTLLLLLFTLLLTGRLPSGFLVLPLLWAPFVLMAVGFGWLFAGLGVYLRDLAHALAALAPVFMFISPVFYSVAQVPALARPFYWANPMTFVLESARNLLFFDAGVNWHGYIIYAAASFCVFLAGYAFFEKVRPGFADVV